MVDDLRYASYAPAVQNGGAAVGAAVAYTTPVKVSLRYDINGTRVITEGGKLQVSKIARIDKLYGDLNRVYHRLVLDNGESVPASEAVRIGN